MAIESRNSGVRSGSGFSPSLHFGIIRRMKAIEYIDRASGEKVTESVMGDGALRFAYETLLGRTLWPVLFGSKTISAIMGRYYDSPLSRRAISSLVSIPGCRADEAELPVSGYNSFNEFFTRRLKPGARPVGNGVVSPADGRLTGRQWRGQPRRRKAYAVSGRRC